MFINDLVEFSFEFNNKGGEYRYKSSVYKRKDYGNVSFEIKQTTRTFTSVAHYRDAFTRVRKEICARRDNFC